MLGTNSGERSSSVAEILILKFFIYWLQHNVSFMHKIRDTESKPSIEFYTVEWTRRGAESE